ncbi:carbohydrate kinase family protein [Aureimonas jatrophae]|uniref:Fructokinase n=1 Tax=Aureimonas jatrophae TaxID=1166073 RepID=A0A1H0J7Y1_9HYPH|nr:carbohydrate kinase [Aureimonas jatrophae]MBB3951547.1 fructokinase [Aureimonas jatrophae]SDO39836.1 fructokinase [Aureimonas jatrophae]
MFMSCGDALFDMFAGGNEADVSSISLAGRIGGSALNVALGLARLEHRSAFFTKMSGDLFGRRIRAFMQQEAIDDRFLIDTTRNTTLAMVSLSPQGTPRYDFYIEGTADRSVEPNEVPSHLPADLAAIHLAGSYSTVSEPTASALAKLVAQEHQSRFISYDPNIRSSVQPDLDIWRSRIGATVPFATLVKASDEDVEQVFPGRNHETVLADWIAAGVGMAIITLGEKGALAMSSGGATARVPGRSVVVADTVGAGDTFQAATLSRLAETNRLSRAALDGMSAQDLGELLDFAVRAAAVTCTRRGADLPRRADLGLPPLSR